VVDTATRPLEWDPPRQAVSRVPYLPGLDGMRALAVLVVMVYHANGSWLPGGFLGVEVFFVISGYLITLLLIGEHERTGRTSLRDFYQRRARRLLPALFCLLIGITIYSAMFRRDALGQLRGDVLAALTYVSNWYQIWVGQGYTASGDFAPLRHLWSLAVEEQFYLVWPLVMIGLIRLGRRRLPQLAGWLVATALLITVITALLYHPGPIETCTTTPGAYWNVAGRCISKADTLYLSTPTRATGLLLGSAFAMVWRPVAVMRGPIRDKGRWLDAGAVLGLAVLGVLCVVLHVITPDGADPLLFRGGFLLIDAGALLVIAAVTHRKAMAGAFLGNPVLLWIGTRSYGLYLYHWPIYQIMRREAGKDLSIAQFVTALIITGIVTELSYRFVETPIRRGQVSRWWRRLQAARDPAPRRVIAGAGATIVAVSVFAVASMATAQLKQNEIAQSLAQGSGAVSNIQDLLTETTTTAVTSTTGTTVPAPGTTAAPPPTGAPTTLGAAPATTVAAAPPTTVAVMPPPPTAPPPTAPPNPIMAIGDSVMLGAAPALSTKGILVDAVVSRQMRTMVPVVQQLAAAGRFGPAVVVHLGTNGAIGDQTIHDFFAALAGVPKVVVLTDHAARDYVAANNQKLAALPAQFPNVTVLYWDGLANQCPGNCFYSDGIHLRPAGQQYYAGLIFQQLGI
jgi:peptidoglycan/LPS O-acetylase OafA/YrhL